MPDDVDLRFLREKFAYYTECQLATLEHYEMRKSSSKSETERHRKIAEGMIECCKTVGAGPFRSTPRLNERLALSTQDTQL